MATVQFDSKGVQTDPSNRQNHFKLLKTVQAYVNAVSQYRLHLFNQYAQSNESYEHQDLLDVRKEILHRFQLAIHELEKSIEDLQARRVSDSDVQEMINRPFMKDIIETSLEANLPSIHDRRHLVANVDAWRTYRRSLQEAKENLHILDFLVHRGILKIDQLVNMTSLYV